MTLRIPRSYLAGRLAGRRAGFSAAVEAVAQRDGDYLLVQSEDWHRLTVLFLDAPPGPRLGDRVAAIAKPVARLIDRATSRLPVGWRTHLAGCRACQQRQVWLNTKPRAWWARLRGRLKGALRGS